MLATIDYEKANLGKKKSRRTKEDLKDKEIENLKLKYKYNEITGLFYFFVILLRHQSNGPSY